MSALTSSGFATAQIFEQLPGFTTICSWADMDPFVGKVVAYTTLEEHKGEYPWGCIRYGYIYPTATRGQTEFRVSRLMRHLAYELSQVRAVPAPCPYVKLGDSIRVATQEDILLIRHAIDVDGAVFQNEYSDKQRIGSLLDERLKFLESTNK